MSAASDHGAADWFAATAAATADDERPARGIARWGGSLALALGVHAAAGVAMVAWHVPVMPADADPPAVLLDLAPLPTPQPEPAPAIDIPVPQPVPEPMPEPVTEPPPPEPPPPEPVVEQPPPPPEPPPVVEPEVVLPKPPPDPPKPKPEVKKEAPPPKPEKPKPEKPKPPRPVAQPVQQAQPAPVAAPPAPAAPAPAAPAAASRAMPSWQGRVLGHLERNKRYPRSAQARRQEGVAQVRFTVDREGRVLSVQLDRSSGVAALDEETVEMVRRASPLPAPPEEIGQDRIELVVPVQFFIR
ncbi:tonB protein (plasmid) [Azospirillum sp. B510]|uniref:energy transducer TonB family protein n=2 Tax=Alphaproteobacteria TaxID=28211 RepID=UPI0001C4C620|nr:energy transducer TonB [Azospirillum sp. B510]BAI76020.1 tonB protein [Azospirillum sp. B510]